LYKMTRKEKKTIKMHHLRGNAIPINVIGLPVAVTEV